MKRLVLVVKNGGFHVSPGGVQVHYVLSVSVCIDHSYAVAC